MNIYLTAIIKSKPGHAEELKPLLLQLVKGSKSEAACLQYDLFQSADDANIYIFHELWKDAEGLALHGTQPHIKDFIANSADIRDGDIIIYSTNPVR
ncbi:Quinol monooxygenase YgiN [Mucilaginibacter pineti]|uniref:Quinol monooxygenase YgiN n=1 Tax=Mucilaginibacter pineti TaxID=1391627 RepID=A0A1G7LUB8_9SPHI|nr:putative quinol monooxygenase [Mucilaginibacter pineti]SDF52550.1 Quinol monooxygenase YgiN [Mucilaginibacter pineti]